jgi:tetratricopeptide (TPR) repeat protein
MGKKSTFFHLLIIIVLGILVYSNTFDVPFIFDDQPNITENDAIKDFKSLTADKSARSRIIGFFTFAINYKLHGLKVTGYHIFNLVVHLINGVLVYWLVMLTLKTSFFSKQYAVSSMQNSAYCLLPTAYSRFIAFFSALIFVSHPIQTQAVTYVVQRFTSLATMFYLLSIVMYIKGRIQQSAISNQPSAISRQKLEIFKLKAESCMLYAASLFSAILAMKTKEIAFTLPIVIVLYEFCFFSRTPSSKLQTPNLKQFIYLLPLLLTIVIIPLSLIGTDKPIGDMIGELRKASQETEAISRSHYLYTQFRVIVTYIRLLFFPVNQNLDYDYPIHRTFFEPQVMLSFLFLLSIFGLGVYLLLKSKQYAVCSKQYAVCSMQNSAYALLLTPYSRLISFGIFWFFITLSVESSIIPIRDVIFEHRIYLPSVGFFISFSTICFYVLWFVNAKLKTTAYCLLPTAYCLLSTAYCLLSTVVIALSITAYTRNSVWKDAISFSQDVIKKSPNKARAYAALGDNYFAYGHYDEAIKEYRTALRLEPKYPSIRTNIGRIYSDAGRFDDAIKEYKMELKMNPNSDITHFNLANVYLNQGKLNDAVMEYQTAIKINPNLADAHSNLGIAYLKAGRIAEAIGEYRTAIGIEPGAVDLRINLGIIYAEHGRLSEAAEEFRIAAKLNPNSFEAHFNLGDVYFKQDDIDNAERQYRMALKINPNSSEAYASLGRCLSKKGNQK